MSILTLITFMQFSVIKAFASWSWLVVTRFLFWTRLLRVSSDGFKMSLDMTLDTVVVVLDSGFHGPVQFGVDLDAVFQEA